MKSFGYAINGLVLVARTQTNFKIHIAAAICAIMLAIKLEINRSEWLAVIFAIGLVMVSETLNTALEFACDAITEKHNENIGKTKDIGAAAVLVSAITAITIAIVIFGPRLIAINASIK